MKIGVLSDSHDNLTNIRRALEVLQAEGAEALIHAGDLVAPFAVRELIKFKGKVYGVFGNNDGERIGIKAVWKEVYPPPHLFTLGGRRIVVMHDRVPPERLAPELRSAEIFIFGHSHKASISREGGGALLINPGETGGWLTGKPTVALLDTEKLEARLIQVQNAESRMQSAE